MLIPLLAVNLAAAETIWSGPDVIVSKPANGNVQDVLTSSVILTRGSSEGIYNAAQETSYDRTNKTSPLDTQWAFLGLNGNSSNVAVVTASNHENLTFSDWAASLGGPPSLQGNIVNRPGVVHLVSDDIYLDIQFTDWGGGGSGGSFAYVRSSVPEPGFFGLIGMSLVVAIAFLRRR